MRALALLPVALALLASPGRAAAAEPSIVARDIPLADERALASSRPPGRFDLVGLHWRGAGSVAFRTRKVGGGWSAWRPAAPEAEDRPDDGARERSRPGWRIGNPYWVGLSDRIEYRLRGRVNRLRAWFVRSVPAPAPPRALAAAGMPAIVPRRAWGADESLRRGPPAYAPALRFALVHHTVGANGYSRAQAPGIVRAVYLYHVRGNGWSDIGYNFLVDRFGQVYEGRYGGIERNVVGAHAAGFNTGSVGVALMGNYSAVQPTPAARGALAALLAWRLDVAHVDPLSSLVAASAGNAKFPPGSPVTLRAISGHRDTGPTACPGTAFYGRLGEVTRATAAIGLPKIYAPALRGRLGGAVRFTARLSSSLPWTVTIADAAGGRVAVGSGTGTTVDWTWDSFGVRADRGYFWSITTPGARGVRGSLGRPTGVPLLAAAAANPSIVSPNGDGRGDFTTVSYTLGTAATVSATLVGPAGTVLTTLLSEAQPAGRHEFAFAPELVLDGAYRIAIAAVASGGKRADVSLPLLISRTLTAFDASAQPFSPNGDGRRETARLAVQLAATAPVELRVRRGVGAVATPFAGALPAGLSHVTWDGTTPTGARAADGAYTAELVLGSLVAPLALRIDTRAPTVRLLARRPLRVWVSEPARIVATVAGRRHTVRQARAGAVRIPLAARAGPVRVVAYDNAENASRPLSR